MNTKQKKTLLGAIVATILVAAIVVVVIAISGGFSSTPVSKPTTTQKLTLEELVAEYKKFVVAGKQNYEHVYMKARVGLKNGDAFVNDHTKANRFALKQVEMFGSKDDIPPEWLKDQIETRIAAMDPIGKKMVIGEPEFIKFVGGDPQGIFKALDETFGEEKVRLTSAYLGGYKFMQTADGDDTVYHGKLVFK